MPNIDDQELTKELVDAVQRMTFQEKLKLRTYVAEQNGERKRRIRAFLRVVVKDLLNAPPPISLQRPQR